MIRLSIIIPAYNAAQYVERCLLSINNEAIRSGISQSEYEIIIVDDCSSDNTIERTLEYFNHLNLSNGKVICHHTNNKGQPVILDCVLLMEIMCGLLISMILLAMES